jgi:hypothetical protein
VEHVVPSGVSTRVTSRSWHERREAGEPAVAELVQDVSDMGPSGRLAAAAAGIARRRARVHGPLDSLNNVYRDN